MTQLLEPFHTLFFQTLLGQSILAYVIMFVVPIFIPIMLIFVVGIKGLRHLEQQGTELAQKAQTDAFAPRLLVGFLPRQQEDFPQEEQQALTQTLQFHEQIKRGATLFQQFLQMIRTRHGEE